MFVRQVNLCPLNSHTIHRKHLKQRKNSILETNNFRLLIYKDENTHTLSMRNIIICLSDRVYLDQLVHDFLLC